MGDIGWALIAFCYDLILLLVQWLTANGIILRNIPDSA